MPERRRAGKPMAPQQLRRGKAVHCRNCSQLRPYIRANAAPAFGDRAGLSVSIEPRLVPLMMCGPGHGPITSTAVYAAPAPELLAGLNCAVAKFALLRSLRQFARISRQRKSKSVSTRT
jgi:hypothetical protein